LKKDQTVAIAQPTQNGNQAAAAKTMQKFGGRIGRDSKRRQTFVDYYCESSARRHATLLGQGRRGLQRKQKKKKKKRNSEGKDIENGGHRPGLLER
jgi:hypothetical protein